MVVYSASKAAHGRRGKDRVGQLGVATSGLRQRLDILLYPGNSRSVATPRRARSISAAPTRPARRMRGSSETKSTIIDGLACLARPASSTNGRGSPSCSTTSSAERPPARPDWFAPVPVKGQLAPRPSARINADRGDRASSRGHRIRNSISGGLLGSTRSPDVTGWMTWVLREDSTRLVSR